VQKSTLKLRGSSYEMKYSDTSSAYLKATCHQMMWGMIDGVLWCVGMNKDIKRAVICHLHRLYNSLVNLIYLHNHVPACSVCPSCPDSDCLIHVYVSYIFRSEGSPKCTLKGLPCNLVVRQPNKYFCASHKETAGEYMCTFKLY